MPGVVVVWGEASGLHRPEMHAANQRKGRVSIDSGGVGEK